MQATCVACDGVGKPDRLAGRYRIVAREGSTAGPDTAEDTVCTVIIVCNIPYPCSISQVPSACEERGGTYRSGPACTDLGNARCWLLGQLGRICMLLAQGVLCRRHCTLVPL